MSPEVDSDARFDEGAEDLVLGVDDRAELTVEFDYPEVEMGAAREFDLAGNLVRQRCLREFDLVQEACRFDGHRDRLAERDAQFPVQAEREVVFAALARRGQRRDPEPDRARQRQWD